MTDPETYYESITKILKNKKFNFFKLLKIQNEEEISISVNDIINVSIKDILNPDLLVAKINLVTENRKILFIDKF